MKLLFVCILDYIMFTHSFDYNNDYKEYAESTECSKGHPHTKSKSFADYSRLETFQIAGLQLDSSKRAFCQDTKQMTLFCFFS